ncbi:hypothetical protein M8C13_02565 [Crossiella sp. SN42]|uniref:hypothetical protein n=1 Tax=Crossiella sp. SN42 TaxID=2944808 RepID=UPI00207D63E9|nr:hypothetical protein [Crossiella sp. SN42]MCO1574640.1 hypothetical protein [Crossiella sp. SN42]
MSVFSDALRAAIDARGLTLERLRHHLRLQDVRVSVATLSYWQRGACRPERPDSLRAVLVLEDILGLPRGQLITLLGPRRPRGRWLDHVPGSLPLERVCPVHAGVRRLLARIQDRADGGLGLLSHHDRIVLGPDREELAIQGQVVLVARRDGVDRHIAVYHSEAPVLPDIRLARQCRIGRVREDRANGLTAVELIFERKLAAGETYVLEYELAYSAGGPKPTDYHRGVRFPIRSYLLQIQFDPAALPARCFRIWQPDIGTPWTDLAELPLTRWGATHLVQADAPPGCHGIRWEWE